MESKIFSQYDTPWKDILKIYFRHFLEYCYPPAASEIDWNRGYESLDKELARILPDSKTNNRTIDKLIKVYRLSGEEAFVLIHCEIQNRTDKNFAKRMFTYRYRLIDHYAKPIASFAILTDSNKQWRPSSYEESLWGSGIKMNFITLKLLDFENRALQLKHSKNPFSIVIEAHLSAQRSLKQSDEQRLQLKIALTRSLYQRGWKKIEIINLYRFIDWMIILPKSYEITYEKELQKIESEAHVRYVCTVERLGIEKGRIQAQREERSTFLKMLLKKSMGSIPETTLQKIEIASDEELKTWITNILEPEVSS